MYNGHVVAILEIFLHQHGMRPTFTATKLSVFPGRVPYAIFAAAAELFVAVYCESEAFFLSYQLISCWWWWEMMGNNSSPMVIPIYIVNI